MPKIVKSYHFGAEAAKILGIPIVNLRSILIDATAGEALTFTAEYYISGTQADSILTELKHYNAIEVDGKTNVASDSDNSSGCYDDDTIYSIQ